MLQSLTNRLRRVTTTGRFVPEIDGLRFVAIMTVVAFHVLTYLRAQHPMFSAPHTESFIERAASTGYFGVELFFVISGFILALPFASHHLSGTSPVKLGRYLKRRLTRLEPPYIVSLLVLSAAWLFVRHAPLSWVATHLPAHIFYVHSFLLGTETGLSTVTWSLEIEIQFYLLVPLLTKAFAIQDTRLRRGLFVAAMMAVGVFSESQHLDALIRSGPPHLFHYLQFFLVGMLLADVYVADWKSKPTLWPLADLFGVAAFAGIFVLVLTRTYEYLLTAPLMFVAYAAVFRGPMLRRIFSFPIFTAIGGMCYTVYLYHNSIIWVAARATGALQIGNSLSLTFLANFIVLAVVTVAVSIPLYLAVERPFMNTEWMSRWFNRKSANTLPAAAGKPSIEG